MCSIEENFSLKNHNTFGINAKAKYFAEFESLFTLKEIISSEIFQNNKSFILGGGSNILLTKDYDGIIIHNKIEVLCILEDNENDITVVIGGGVIWHNFVRWRVSQ